MITAGLVHSDDFARRDVKRYTSILLGDVRPNFLASSRSSELRDLKQAAPAEAVRELRRLTHPGAGPLQPALATCLD